ncbi:transposase [Pseudogracilibacillus auburnensis]|uniref:transposase n=1 Tax=Pseudogracilibacillus auburnensis TaxID=1494959 RepID=UPI001A96993A|nr:transposase [Pseudogracilibacillus auburnensis]MBO1003009.1 transposase [Pseudogracilibacillus auburnensis]
MKIVIILGSMVVPIIMFFLQRVWTKCRFIFNLLAIICALIFGNISATAIYEIIRDKTVFMTNIHAIFLNPLFLFTGAYLGVYILYLLLILTLED